MSKRRLSSPPATTPSASLDYPAVKRARQHLPVAHLTRLSDELILRIASFLPPAALASFQLVSRRCQRIAVDHSVWRSLYQRRFLRRKPDSVVAGTNWKRLYKLRHNWGIGSCKIQEIDAGEKSQRSGALVKLWREGTVVTVDSRRGLRAWSVGGEGGGGLIATRELRGDMGNVTALAVDEDVSGSGNVIVGFSQGGFAVYQLDRLQSSFQELCLHSAEDERVEDAVKVLACLGPYLSVAVGEDWKVYHFNDGMEKKPTLLSSLRSSTVWPPLTLSLRHSVNCTVLAAISYAYPLYVSGWSVGMQELRFATRTTEDKKTTMILAGSRIATAVAAGFTSLLPGSISPTWTESHRPRSQRRLEEPPLSRPTSLSYFHPYLVASHADNTLALYMVRSTESSLDIEPGTRLWGHTSAVESVQVGGRGKAVSISNRGSQSPEIRVWELEGGVSDRRRVNGSVRVEPVVGSSTDGDVNQWSRWSNSGSYDTGDSVDIYPEVDLVESLGGFDDEKVVVLREAYTDVSPGRRTSPPSSIMVGNARLALVVYDFTR